MQINIKYKLFFIIFIMFFCNFNGFINAEDEIWYVEYNKGDKIEYNGIDFYVIEDSDKTKDYVTLIKKTPLTREEVNKYGIDENGINHVNRYTQLVVGTAYNYNGVGGMAYYSSENCGYVNGSLVNSGCASENATSYDTSDIKYVVDAWSKDRLTMFDLIEDDLGYKTRLITKDEIINNFGYIENNVISFVQYLPSKDTPSWIYNKNYPYWTMDTYQDSPSEIWNMSNSYYPTGCFYVGTVRPVINLKKNNVELGKVDQNKTINSKEFKIGDIVDYNGIRFYAIENSDETKKTVALLKAEPLTTAEVNKYGKGFVNKDTEKKEAVDYNGYGSIAYYSSDTCTSYTPTPKDCTSDYDASDIKYVVDNWSNDVLGGLNLTEDKTGYKVRLITKEEIIDNLSFSVNSNGIYHASIDTPYWVYSNFYSYLTMTPVDDSNSNVFTVNSKIEPAITVFYGSIGGYSTFKGVVRPVIILAKNLDNTVTEKVEVPNTNLSVPIILGVISTVIIITSFIIVYFVLKRRKTIK